MLPMVDSLLSKLYGKFCVQQSGQEITSVYTGLLIRVTCVTIRNALRSGEQSVEGACL